ncbi:MAG: hypothetical protein FWC47_11640 [Oscillospiraceae bacterium]|nr:hypothetical protein [Oscillospiraceae bacterium]
MFTYKKAQRIPKAKQWLITYKGSTNEIIRNYREKFHVDVKAAINDLQKIGVEFTQEYLDTVLKSEEDRIRQLHLKKEKKQAQDADFYDEYSNDTFAFIAGYTSGGAPYGVTWDELGIDPYASYEEIEDAYYRMGHMEDMEEDIEYEEDDLDFYEEEEMDDK